MKIALVKLTFLLEYHDLFGIKATNRGPQWNSDNMMQILIYLATSWYFNTKSK